MVVCRTRTIAIAISNVCYKKKLRFQNSCSSRRDRQVINKNVVKIETRLWTTLIYYFLRLSGSFFYLFWCKAATCLPERDIGKSGKKHKKLFPFSPARVRALAPVKFIISKKKWNDIYILCKSRISEFDQYLYDAKRFYTFSTKDISLSFRYYSHLLHAA